MPAPCYPVPHGSAPERTPFHRSYLDPLGEPLTGTVTIVATQRADKSGAVVPEGTPAVVELVDGVLEVHLQAGYYRLTAELCTASGHKLTDEDVVTVTAG